MSLDTVRKHIASFPFKTRLVFMAMVMSLLIFGVVFTLAGNGEFVYYALVSFLFFLFIISYYHKLKLTDTLLIGISLHWLLSFMGGTLYLGGTRLYDVWILPFIRYDNIVHTFGVFILTFIAFNLLRPHFKLKDKISLFHFSLLLFFIVMGLGAVAEIMELMAVLWMGAGETVGDYFNNAYDLVWNGIGAILACLLIARYEYGTTLQAKNRRSKK